MKMHLKKKRRKLIHYKLIIILILSLIASFFVIHYINKNVLPNINSYAKAETKKIATIIINRAVTKQAAEEIDINELINTTLNNSGEVVSIDFNSYIVNKTLSSLSSTIQLNLKRLEQGKIEMIELPDDVFIEKDKNKLKKGIIYEFPLGLALNNSLLSNIGPKIPVKLNLIGHIEANFKSKVTEYGINNALLEIIINVKVTEQVILPITSEEVVVETDVPVAIKLMQGSVPKYYSKNNESGTVSIPIEK